MEAEKNSMWRPRLLLLAVFLAIGSGIVYELLIAACSAHLWGDSIYQFSLTIGLFMSAMGVGSYVSQKFSDGLVEVLARVLLAMALFGGMTFLMLRLADLYTASYLAVAHAWTVLLGGLVGLALPLAIRVIEANWPVKKLLAQVLFVDYLGALVGSLALPWFLLPRLGFAKTSVFVALVCLLSCLLLLLGFGREVKRKAIYGQFALVGVLLVVGWWGSEPLLQVLVAKHHKNIQEVYVVRSPYQEIRFVGYRKTHFLFLNRQPQFSSQDEHRYHESLVHPAMSLAPKRTRVLLLGGGDGLALRDIWRYHDVKEVVMVDLDPAMTRFGATHPLMRKMNHDSMTQKVRNQRYCLYEEHCPGKPTRLRHQRQVAGKTTTCPTWKPPTSAQTPASCQLRSRSLVQRQTLTVVNRDAWKFAEQTPKSFSVILSDLPDATNISLSKLYSVAFYRLLRRKLADDGIMAVQSTSVMPGFQQTFWCILHTIQAAGFKARGYHAWVPSFGAHTSYTLAGKSLPDPSQIRLQVPTLFLNQEVLPSLFWWPKDIAEVKTRANRIDTHILLRYLLRGR